MNHLRQDAIKLALVGKRAKGFSLIELLVVMALVGILAGIGGSIFIMINTANTRAVALAKLQTQGSQNLEVLTRAIRSSGNADVLAANANGCLADATSCLRLQVISGSVEYTLNGGCYYTYYAWYAPTTGTNGRLVRYYLSQNLATCATGPSAYDLFDIDSSAGTSVELASGSSALFEIFPGDDSIDQIKVSATLFQGVGWKPQSGDDTRVSVPFLGVTGLRNY